jgi:hypothetical protein
LCACNKGYARFLPKSLVSVILRNGRGWTSKESFLFVVDYWPKKISMRAIIAPGNESTRKASIDIISNIEGAKIPRGKQFLSYFSVLTKIDVTAETYEDEEKLAEAFRKFLRKNDELIGRIEETILSEKERLE